jgi:hypothetical protein
MMGTLGRKACRLARASVIVCWSFPAFGAECHGESITPQSTAYERGIEEGRERAYQEVEPLMKTTYVRTRH